MTPTITPDEVTLWSRLIHEVSGIYIESTKSYLLTTRLQSLLKETNASGFSDLYYKAKGSAALQNKVVDAISTNETSFFRDGAPFDLLRNKLIPELIDRRVKSGSKPIPIRIWSAACSTGQEAYTIGITLKEMLGSLDNYDIRIVGTDISGQAVAAASRAIFGELEMQRGLPNSLLTKYFSKDPGGWKVRDEIRAMASFRPINLLRPFNFPVPFDIVFCRNVAIYFTEADRVRLFTNIGKCLSRQGALIIGSTESLTGLCPDFIPERHLRAVYYRLREPM